MIVGICFAMGVISLPAQLTGQDAVVYGMMICGVLFFAQLLLQPDVGRNKAD